MNGRDDSEARDDSGRERGPHDPAGAGEGPESPWVAPPVRGEALVATWSLLLGGHVVGCALTAWALTTPAATRSVSRPGLLLALLALGACGAAMAAYGLRFVLSVRRRAASAAAAPVGFPAAGSTPAPTGPSPLVLAWLLVLAAVGIAVIALVGWGAATVLPAVAGEFVFVPLAMRTTQYAQDVAAEATDPPQAS